jgi:hypothetical protein
MHSLISDAEVFNEFSLLSNSFLIFQSMIQTLLLLLLPDAGDLSSTLNSMNRSPAHASAAAYIF